MNFRWRVSLYTAYPGSGAQVRHLSGAAGAAAVSQPDGAGKHPVSSAARARSGKRLAEKLRQLQCQLNLDATASTLEVADQQMVEILRGLMRNARILILDEPTASLTPGETERLFRQIRALQDLGVGIVLSRISCRRFGSWRVTSR